MSNYKKGEGKFVQLGALIKKKDGSGFYIKVDKELSISINGRTFKGEYISCAKPQEKYDRMLAKDKITQEQYDEKVQNIPSYIRQELTLIFED